MQKLKVELERWTSAVDSIDRVSYIAMDPRYLVSVERSIFLRRFTSKLPIGIYVPATSLQQKSWQNMATIRFNNSHQLPFHLINITSYQGCKLKKFQLVISGIIATIVEQLQQLHMCSSLPPLNINEDHSARNKNSYRGR